MNTITVYRIENKAGQGFYNCSGSDITHCPTYRQDHEKHPPASREIMKTLRDKGWPTNMIFGFESLEKLKTWVHREDWAQFLDENGFDICGFKVCESNDGLKKIASYLDTQKVFCINGASFDQNFEKIEREAR